MIPHHHTRTKYYMSTGLLKIQGCAHSVRLRFPRRQCSPASLKHHDVLRSALPELSYLQTGFHLCFAQDGASPHFLLAIWQLLNNTFRPTARRARSPDLNPSDFYICRHQSLQFVLQKAVTPTTCNNEYRMGLRRFVRHWNFPASQAITVPMCNVPP
jgi:hypothetical protein